MSRYDAGWPRYVPVDERRRKAEREIEKLRKKGHSVAPIKIEGRTIAATFWGKAWCDNLESYRDYESRLPRGRTYVRNGSVLDLQIAAREVTAMVSGSSIYRVAISIGTVPKAHWQSICADCGTGIDSVVELLQGRLAKGVMERLCRQSSGLFPTPSDIRFTCTCPDYASMCKHVAAVLYGVGARLDREPELLFRLRAVNENDLVADIGTALPLSKKSPAAGRMLDVGDVSALFGLDMAGADAPGEAGDGPSPAPSLPDERKPSRISTKTAVRQSAGSQAKDPVDQRVTHRRAPRAVSAGARNQPTAARKTSTAADVSRPITARSQPAQSAPSKVGKDSASPGPKASRKPAPVVAATGGR